MSPPSANGNNLVHLKGSVAGMYSLCGGAGILLLTKVGGLLSDRISPKSPFYLLAGFNGLLLIFGVIYFSDAVDEVEQPLSTTHCREGGCMSVSPQVGEDRFPRVETVLVFTGRKAKWGHSLVVFQRKKNERMKIEAKPNMKLMLLFHNNSLEFSWRVKTGIEWDLSFWISQPNFLGKESLIMFVHVLRSAGSQRFYGALVSTPAKTRRYLRTMQILMQVGSQLSTSATSDSHVAPGTAFSSAPVKACGR
ncbi:hypothetical protein HCDG_06997 [Histoplasma capsulatum H143]|uniref:Uncharacterized protein n=1 Tax=Ajellomyces capsulatus (strain H143) TaxID=544712 RepID=C6HLB6_AJECH|nr:hypothetical protein HCDG_06997 [Histoplasma capsulatum H143]